MRRLSELFIGHIVYYNYVIDRLTEDNFEKCLATPFVPLLYYRAVQDKWCLFKLPVVENG